MVLHDNHSDRSMLISLILARFVLVLLLNRNHLFHRTSLLQRRRHQLKSGGADSQNPCISA